MPIDVILPDGSTRSFPTGTSDDDIRAQLVPSAASEKLRSDMGITNPPPEVPSFLRDLGNRFERGGAQAVGDTMQGLDRVLGALAGPTKIPTAIGAWGGLLKQGADEAFPTDPARDQSILSSLASSAGAMVPTIAASVVNPALGPLQYGVAQGEQMAQEAEQAGHPELAMRAMLLGGSAATVSEALLGVAPKFGARFGFHAAEDAVPQTLTRALLHGAGYEAAQEGTEQFLQNQIAKQGWLAGYDPDRPAMQGVGESALVGGLLGAPVSGVGHFLGPRVDHEAVKQIVSAAEQRLETEPDQNTALGLQATIEQGNRLLKLPPLKVGEAKPLAFEKIAGQEGMGEVTDFVTEPGRQVKDAEGNVAAVSEADTDLGVGRTKVYLPEIQDAGHLRRTLREEKTHLWINTTDDGRAALASFLESHPLPEEEVKTLQADGYLLREGETDPAYRSRLGEEYLAKLTKDGWWKRTTSEFTATIKKALGLSLTPEQAGRLLLRNAKSWTALGTQTPLTRQGNTQPPEPVTPPTAVSEAGVVAPASPVRESLRPVSLKASEGDGGVLRVGILSEGRKIGLARVMGTTLGDIEIYPRYRRQGFGLSAIKALESKYGVNSAFQGSAEGGHLLRAAGWTSEPSGRWTRPNNIRESLRRIKPDEEMARLAQVYPGVKFVQESRTGQSAQYDPEQKAVSLSGDYFKKFKWDRDNEVRAALMEAGVAQLPSKALSEDVFYRLKQADPKRVERTLARMGASTDAPTPEQRRDATARMLLEQIQDQRIGLGGRVLGATSQIAFKLAGLSRLASRMGLAWAGHSGSRGMLAVRNLLENMVEKATLPPLRTDALNPEQVFSDLHAHVVTTLGPGIRDLRARAAELEHRSYARQLWKTLSQKTDALAQEVEINAKAHPERLAHLVDAEGAPDFSFSPMSEKFEETATAALGRPLTGAELDGLARYRDEVTSRSLANKLDEREKLQAEIENVDRLGGPTWSPVKDALAEKLAQVNDEISKAEEQHLHRADEIRASDALVPQARAARSVLSSDPDVAAWAAQYDRATDSGLGPREAKDLTDHTILARDALRDRATIQAHDRADAAEQDLGDFLTKTYGPALRDLKKRLLAQNRQIGENEVAISEIAAALAGEADRSGTATGRDAAIALRDYTRAIARFALRLTDAQPGTLVAEMRDALTKGQPGNFWLNQNAAAVGQAVGLGEDAARGILRLLAESPEFHNALFELHQQASGEAGRSVISAIKRIEAALKEAATQEAQAELRKELGDAVAKPQDPARFRNLAQKIADTKIDELANINRGLQRDVTSTERELAELEEKRLAKQYAADFFRVAAEGLGEKPNQKRMVFNTADGARRIEGFKGPEGEVKPIVLRPGDAFDEGTYKGLTHWLTQAAEAIRQNTDDPQVLRGLVVGIGEVEKLVSSRFSDDQIAKTLAASYPVEWLLRRTWLRTQSLIPKTVPGVWGAVLQQASQAWNFIHAKAEKLKLDEAAKWDRLQRQASKSLGLDPSRRPADISMLKAVYNEVANRLRRHGSGVEEGNLIWANRGIVTPELLTWLKYDLQVLGKGAKLEQSRPYGGVRENFPGGQIVRKGAPTGDVGLPRRADLGRVAELRSVYLKQPRERGQYLDRTAIDTWWAQQPNAIGSHVQDPLRDDVAITRHPDMVQAELALSKAIDTGRVSLTALHSVDDWSEAIGRFLPNGSRVDPRVELRRELDQYGAHSIAREGSGRDLSTPSKTALTVSGEDDTTAFTQPAAKMYYPPSFYQYGTSQGLNAALDQLTDPAQKEYLEALRQAQDHLNAKAHEIRDAIPRGDFKELAGLIRWTLEGQVGRLFSKGKTEITPEMAQHAADVLASHAAIINAERARINEPARGSLLSRLLNQLWPWLLLRPTTLASNVFGGPITAQPVLSHFFGEVKGSLLSFGAFPYSAGSFVVNQGVDTLRWLANTAMADKVYASEIDLALANYGIGGSFNHDFSGEGERVAAGRLGMSPIQKALSLAKGAANEASGVMGVRAGDKYLNRALSTSVVPAIFWKLRQAATSWQARAQAEVAEGKVKSVRDVVFDERDDGRHAQIREFLQAFGKTEELLLHFAKDDLPWFHWWRGDETLGKLGYALLQELNVGSPTNRPAKNTLMGLMGWTSKMIDNLVNMTRVTPDTGTLERWRKGLAYSVFGALAASTAYYFGALGRQMVAGGIVAGATAIAKILQGVPVNDDDPKSVEKALNALAAVNGWLRQHSHLLASTEDLMARAATSVAAVSQPASKALPYEKGFWERPWQDVAQDLVTSVPGGVGVNQVQLPVLGIGQQFASSGLQIGRGAMTFAENPTDAGRAAALADLKSGTRNMANLFGLVGQSALEFLVPGGETGRDTRTAVAHAANKEGVRVEAAFQSGSLLSATPVRKEIMSAGAELASAQERGDTAAVEAAQKKIDDLTQFVADRAQKRATELGQDPETARKAGESAVKKLMGQLDPIRYGVGRSVTPEEAAKLESAVGQNAAVRRDRKAARAVIARVAGRRGFLPSRSMLSPIRVSRVPKLSLRSTRTRLKL